MHCKFHKMSEDCEMKLTIFIKHFLQKTSFQSSFTEKKIINNHLKGPNICSGNDICSEQLKELN